jgi:hypothetical protein
MVAAYHHPDRKQGKTMTEALIAALAAGITAGLAEIATSNTYARPLSASGTSPTIARSLLESGGFRPRLPLDCQEPNYPRDRDPSLKGSLGEGRRATTTPRSDSIRT